MGGKWRGWSWICTLVALGAALPAFTVASAAAARATLAGSFGHRGVVLTGFGEQAQRNSQWIADMAVEPSGRIVFGAVAPRGGFTLERLNLDGSLDRSFGGDGQVATAIKGRAMAVEPSGAVIVAGSIGEGDPGQDIAVMRYRPNGRVDRTFGRRGIVRVDLGLEEASAEVVLQPGGSIVVAGRSGCAEGDRHCAGGERSEVVLVRLRGNGEVVSTRRFRKARRISSLTAGKGGGLAAVLDYGRRSSRPKLLRLDARGLSRRNFGDGGAVAVGSYPDFGSVLLQGDAKPVLAGFGLRGGGLRRLDARGRPDSAFGEGGSAVCAAAGPLHIAGSVPLVAIFPDGRLLAGGGPADCGLVRYLADGSPDPSFGLGGRIDPASQVGGPPDAIATGPGETSVIARWERGAGVRLARYLVDGSPDPSFGRGGATTVPSASASFDQANALLALSHGRLLAVGTAACADRSCGEFALARYRPGGKLDRRFGRGGLVRTDPGGVGVATAAAIQRDGRIVVVGGSGERDHGELVEERLAAARYLPGGRLDRSFGRDGIVTLPGAPGENVQANAVAIAGNGDIVVAGAASCDDSERCGERYCSECGEFVVARFRPDGRPVGRFGRGGVLRVDVGHSTEDHDAARAVAIARGGKIVVVGRTHLGSFGLLRLLPSGRRDPTFGRRGVVRTRFHVRLRDSKGKVHRLSVNRPATSLALLADGKIVVAGGSGLRPGYRNHGAVVRYLPDGRIDRGFGRGGRIDTGRLAVNALAVDRCGRLALAGAFNPRKGVNRFGLTRRLPSGAPDPAFVGRVARLVGSGEDALANGVALSRGRIVAAGTAAHEGAGTDFALVAFRGERGCGR